MLKGGQPPKTWTSERCRAQKLKQSGLPPQKSTHDQEVRESSLSSKRMNGNVDGLLFSRNHSFDALIFTI